MSDLPLLYLLAGNGSSAEWWDDVLPHFQQHQVVPLELPGFGNNPQPPCEDLAAYADALLAATVRGSAIVAVGVNALLVMHALQRQPGHFCRSVLLAPVGANCLSSSPDEWAFYNAIADRFRDGGQSPPPIQTA